MFCTFSIGLFPETPPGRSLRALNVSPDSSGRGFTRTRRELGARSRSEPVDATAA